MEEQKDTIGLLDMIVRPVFCVKENTIVRLNQAARQLFLSEGTDIGPLLRTGAEEYAAFAGGCLYLTLEHAGVTFGASVSRMEDMDVFLLDSETDDGELRVLALAARELREPLSGVMTSAARLPATDDPAARAYAARLNRGLHQLLRIIGNMSDAGSASLSFMELRNIGDVFTEICEKAGELLSRAGITMTYENLKEEILCQADAAQLERAVLNLLSNAAKFTPKGGTVHLTLTRRGKMLRLGIRDSGSGIGDDILHSLYSRYLRQPGLGDSRQGIGLGMVLIRKAAAAHGGTVLVHQPDGCGTKITVTLAIRQDTGGQLRSSRLTVDRSGGFDPFLVELADILPDSLYEN